MFRKADINDLDRITEIYDEVHSEVENGNIITGWIRGLYPVRKTAENAILKGEMFVGENNGQIVSAAIINKDQGARYADAAWDYEASEDEVMVLHTLVVSPKVKGKGYGSKFVDFYEQYALDAGCSYVRMDTNEHNLDARKLYKKLAYKEVSILPSEFYGIEGVKLVLLEKKLK